MSDRKPQLLFVCSHNRATTVPQDNWIRSPFFAIEDAVVVSLDISSDVEKCNFASYPNCKEEFSVYFQFTDGADNSDPINGTYFSLSVRLPQDKSQLNQMSNFIKAVNVTVPRKRGMFIAFRDTGGCTHIHKAIVRYNYCPSVTENLADFPRTVARASQVHVVGKCRENASSQSSLPQKLCRTSGEWSTLPGSCECNAGHSLAEDVCKGIYHTFCICSTFHVLCNYHCEDCILKQFVVVRVSGHCKIDLVPLNAYWALSRGKGFSELPVDVKEKRSKILVFYLAKTFTKRLGTCEFYDSNQHDVFFKLSSITFAGVRFV